jgi:hypothetical protein
LATPQVAAPAESTPAPTVAGEAPAKPPTAAATATDLSAATITAPLVIEATTATTPLAPDSTSTTAGSNLDAMIDLAGDDGQVGADERIPLVEQLATGLRASAGVTP